MRIPAFRRRRSAFTLIELLVVVGIIAVLISILFPVFSGMRERARRTQCAANLRQIGAAIFAYAADNNGKLFHHRRSYIYHEWLHQYGAALHQALQYDERRNSKSGYHAFIPPDARTNNIFIKHSSYPQIYESESNPGWANPLMPTVQEIEAFNGYSATFGQAWEDQGGVGGFIESIFPKYLNTCKVLVCPSVKHFAYKDAPTGAFESQTNYQALETALRANVGKPLANRTGYTMIATYIGAVYGRLGRGDRTGDAQTLESLWPGYYLQGYYPRFFHEDPARHDFLRFMRNALMYDVGSYVFWNGFNHGLSPHANEGCHDIGGNFLSRDGSVTWWNYPWYKRENQF